MRAVISCRSAIPDVGGGHKFSVWRWSGGFDCVLAKVTGGEKHGKDSAIKAFIFSLGVGYVTLDVRQVNRIRAIFVASGVR